MPGTDDGLVAKVNNHILGDLGDAELVRDSRVDVESPLPFLAKEPIDIMKEGSYVHVPWMTGLTDDEGAFKASAMMNDMKAVQEMEAEFERLGPLVFGFHDGQCEAPKIHSQQLKAR